MMIHDLIFNRAKKLFVLILISTLLTGCMATQKALRKVDADRQFLGYESVYISKDMDIVVNYKVRFNKHGRFTGTDETWCARLPLEETYNQSRFVAEVTMLPYNRATNSLIKESSDQYNNVGKVRTSLYISTDDKNVEKNLSMLDAVDESHFTNINSKCNIPGDDFVKVLLVNHHQHPETEFRDSWTNRSGETAPPVYFMSTDSYALDERSYIIFTEHESEKSIYRAVKIDQPLPYQEYDMTKLLSVPYYVVIDVVSIPLYIFLLAVGPF